MNKIPTYDSQLSPTGETGVNFTSAEQKSHPYHIPFVEDTSMKVVADAMKDISDRMYKAEAVEQTNDGIAALAKGAAEIKVKSATEWNTLPTDEHMKRFEQSYKELENKVLSSANNGAAKSDLANRAKLMNADVYVDVKTTAFKAQVDRGLAKGNKNIQDLENAAILAKSEKEMLAYRSQISEIVVGINDGINTDLTFTFVIEANQDFNLSGAMLIGNDVNANSFESLQVCHFLFVA
jgi:hypothetical protein